jgi:hypothetical protein
MLDGRPSREYGVSPHLHIISDFPRIHVFSMMLARREVTDFGTYEKILWG